MKFKPPGDLKTIIDREEYDALMSELPTPEDLQPGSITPELDEKFRKIEFYMMVIVALILVVLVLSQRN